MTTTTSTTTIAVSRPPSTSSFSAVYPGNDARYINNELDIRWVMQQCPSTVSHHPHLTYLTIINSSAVSCSYNPIDCTHLCSNHPYYNYLSIHPSTFCMHVCRYSFTESMLRSVAHSRLELHRKLPKTESLKDCMSRTIPYYRPVR